MSVPTPLSRASLAATILASTIGTYIALTPPNPNASSASSTKDFLHSLNLTNRHVPRVVLFPLVGLSLYTSSLIYLWPNVSTSFLHCGTQNGLNTDLFRWSAATSIPLALILGAGVPLRLVPYSSLGKDFTFNLAEPDHLTTTGIYKYLQHPSYTGVVVLVLSNMLLFGRTDGVLTCSFRPRLYSILRMYISATSPLVFSLLMFLMWTRVKEEERMLSIKFGDEWRQWHSTTARFIPWLL